MYRRVKPTIRSGIPTVMVSFLRIMHTWPLNVVSLNVVIDYYLVRQIRVAKPMTADLVAYPLFSPSHSVIALALNGVCVHLPVSASALAAMT